MGKSGSAKPKRKYVKTERLLAALDGERTAKRRTARRETCGFRADDPRIEHPKLGPTVTVEMRTGSGVMTRTVSRSGAFRPSAGVVRQTAGRCNPAIHHCLDGFYARIDYDLKKLQYEQDVKLKVPYAVKEHRRRRRQLGLLRKYAVERGLV